MKLSALVLFLLLGHLSFSQRLNSSGHILGSRQESFPLKVEHDQRGFFMQVGNMQLLGCTAFKIPYGYVTFSAIDEYSTNVFRFYDLSGKELYRESFSQTINIRFSENGRYCAFYEKGNIRFFDLLNRVAGKCKGSSVFAIDNAGRIASYSPDENVVAYDNLSIPVQEHVYDIIFFQDSPLMTTRTEVLRIANDRMEAIFRVEQGRVFEVKVAEELLYISTKLEASREFIFTSYVSQNGLDFRRDEEVHYPLLENPKGNPAAASGRNMQKRVNESILNPLYYYQDSVYQPVGNSYNEIQEYTPGDPYLHPGVDLLGNFNQEVFSVKDGFVKAVLTTSGQYHWRVAVANDNTPLESQGYLYAHLDEWTIPYAPGDTVMEGQVLGRLTDFPYPGFQHCHFARIVDSGIFWTGDWWTFDNPLSYMTNFLDTTPPEFEFATNLDLLAFRDANGNYLSPFDLHGDVRVIAKVFDRVNSTWHCDVSTMRYSMYPLLSPLTLVVDTFAFENDYYNDEYLSGSYHLGVLNTIYSRDSLCFSDGDYLTRDFYHIITSSDGNDTINFNDSLQFLSTTLFPDGSYIFRVEASDASGNVTVDSMEIVINNSGVGIGRVPSEIGIEVHPNPLNTMAKIISNAVVEEPGLEVYNALGELVRRIEMEKGSISYFTRDNLPVGLYFFQFTSEGNILAIKKVLIVE